MSGWCFLGDFAASVIVSMALFIPLAIFGAMLLAVFGMVLCAIEGFFKSDFWEGVEDWLIDWSLQPGWVCEFLNWLSRMEARWESRR